jgi:competence protein ComEC
MTIQRCSKLRTEGASVLLEGDAERRTERRIAPELGPVNLLKVAHHGSATSSIVDLLARIHPQFAVISGGQFNHYGHPKQEILQRLRQSGACTFRTDLTGALSFYLDAMGVVSARWGGERQTIEFPSGWIAPNQAQHCAAAR